jgi:hypothetical protein
VTWRDERIGVTWELARHFWRRFLDFEPGTSPEAWRGVMVSAIAVVLPSGILFFDQRFYGKYLYLSSLPTPGPYWHAARLDELAALILAMTLAGAMTCIHWRSVFPERVDYLAFEGLPVRAWQLFAAKISALTAFVTLFAAAFSTIPCALLHIAMSSRWQRYPSLPGNAGAHFIASLLASWFAFFLLVALHGVLLNFLPKRWFAVVSPWIQGGILALCAFVSVACLSLEDLEAAGICNLGGSFWFPPVWFLGLHEHLLGDAVSGAAALCGTAAVAGLALLLCLVSYGRHQQVIFDAGSESPEGWRGWNWLIARLSSNSSEHGIVAFIWAVSTRSRTHQMVLSGYWAVGVAVILSRYGASVTARRSGGIPTPIELEAICALLLAGLFGVTGLRYAFSLPFTIRANWIFRTIEGGNGSGWLCSVDRFLAIFAFGPFCATSLLLGCAILGWRKAILAAGLTTLAVVLLYNGLFFRWNRVPFTCTHQPGRRSLIAGIVAYGVTILLLIPATGAVVLRSLSSSTGLALLLTVLGLACIRCRRARRQAWSRCVLAYDDKPDDEPIQLFTPQ